MIIFIEKMWHKKILLFLICFMSFKMIEKFSGIYIGKVFFVKMQMTVMLDVLNALANLGLTSLGKSYIKYSLCHYWKLFLQTKLCQSNYSLKNKLSNARYTKYYPCIDIV